MQELAPKVMKARDIWPFPVVESAGRLDENVSLVAVCRSTINVSDLVRAKSVILLSLNDIHTDLNVPL